MRASDTDTVIEHSLGLRAGEWVEVRSAGEILSTLDGEGALDALPFMPEMLPYCGRRFRVHKSAHKSCDTLKTWRNRRMKDAVHLEGLRCTGTAHGGCQAACLLYFKEAWLRRVDGPGPGTAAATGADAGDAAVSVPAAEMLQRGTRAPAGPEPGAEERFRCQATEMFRATTAAHWDAGLYLRDITSGNVTLREFLYFGLIALLNRLRPYPHIRGRAGRTTPAGEALNLQPGEWVKVRPREEILRTVNRKLRHRGLSFDIEMLPFCGKTYRVLARVERLIDDRSGRMLFPRSACLILEGVACGGCLSRNRMFCPRAIHPYWHEVWLERVAPGAAGTAAASPGVPGRSPGA